MKAKISVPVPSRKNKFNLSCHHETTLNFGSILPAYNYYMAPGESIKVDVGVFSRVAPLVVPTFGDVRLNLRAFNVPFSKCWPYFNDYINGLPSPQADGSGFVYFSRCPSFTQKDFISVFVHGERDNSDPFCDLVGYETSDVDFIINQSIFDPSDISFEGYRFTYVGKCVIQILHSLGYKIPWTMDVSSSGAVNGDGIVYNALPLIAFCELFFEYFVPQQYRDSSPYREFRQQLHNISQSNCLLSQPMLGKLLQVFVLAYKQDYFTSVWVNPNSPVDGLISEPILNSFISPIDSSLALNHASSTQDIEEGVNSISTIESSEGVGINGSRSLDVITAWGMKLSERVQSWLTRHNLVGSDRLNLLLSDFGIKPTDKLGCVRYCGDSTLQMQIDPVFDTSSDGLGEFAGRATIVGGKNHFECTALEHSLFIIVATVEPVTSFVNGTDRLCLYSDKFDFFNGDFDGINMQAMPVQELHSYYQFDHRQANSNLRRKKLDFTQCFGFVPRYAERKYPRNRLTGDFMINRLKGSIEGFSLERRLVRESIPSNPLVGNETVQLLNGQTELTVSGVVKEYDVSQYNRIFADTTGFADPFITLFDFRVTLESPMKPFKDSYEMFEHTDNNIELDKNGAYSN